jgi:hypothetical protein
VSKLPLAIKLFTPSATAEPVLRSKLLKAFLASSAAYPISAKASDAAIV